MSEEEILGLPCSSSFSCFLIFLLKNTKTSVNDLLNAIIIDKFPLVE